MIANTEKDVELIAKLKHFENIPWSEDYEKMVSGMLYNCMTPSLVEGRHIARRKAHQYNSHFPDDCTADSLTAERETMLRSWMGRLGSGAFIEPPFRVDYGFNISIGDGFYANFGLIILDCSLVSIGDRVMCGPNVCIYAATHETEVESRRQMIEYARKVTIGSDVWIGGGSTILPGVTIGDGVTIGAGSLVTRDIPAWSVVHGSE